MKYWLFLADCSVDCVSHSLSDTFTFLRTRTPEEERPEEERPEEVGPPAVVHPPEPPAVGEKGINCK